MENGEVRKLNGLEMIETYIYNFKYLFDFSSKKLIQNTKDNVSMLGRNYTSISNNLQDIETEHKKFQQEFSRVVWFTYRYNFEPLLPEIFQQNYIHDTGWGCMLRVGQMMCAEVLKRQLFYEEFLNNQIKPDQLHHIISLFNDNQDCHFSIQNIARIAHDDTSLSPGEWYNPGDICYCLQTVNQNIKSIEPDLKPLEFLIFKENMINLDEIYDKFEVQNCSCDLNEISEETIKTKTQGSFLVIDQVKKEQCQACKSCQKSVCVIILTRLGLDKINSIYINPLKSLFKTPYFTGMLGGRPKSAHYFIGLKENQLIYLDPHFPQMYSQNPSFDTYFRKEIRLYNINQIAPSLALTYYLRKPSDAKQFYRFLENIKQQYKDLFFFSLNLQTPDYVQNPDKFDSEQDDTGEKWEILM